MRRVILGGTGIETSALGFGCASLGTRVGRRGRPAGARGGARRRRHLVRPRPGLRRRRGRGDRRAVPEGAPRHGAGRDQGRAGARPAGAGGGAPAAADAARPRRAGAGRAAARRAGGAAAPGGAEGQRQAAADARADRRLARGEPRAGSGLDHVDLFALHAPDPDEVGRDDILRRARGDARRRQGPGGGGRRRRGGGGGGARGRRPLRRGAARGAAPGRGGSGRRCSTAAPAAGFGTIVHSVFGAGGGARPAEGRRRLARAFALNPDGVVLVSMLSAASRAATLAAAGRAAGRRSGRPPRLDAGRVNASPILGG